MTQLNLSMKQKQTHRYRGQICGCQGGSRGGGAGMGVWDQQMQTGKYRIDKQQGPTVEHKELIDSISRDKP